MKNLYAALLLMLLMATATAEAQTWNFATWKAGTVASATYYKTDQTALTDAPADSLNLYLYADASDVITFTSEVKSGSAFYCDGSRIKLYGGSEASDASAANGYQPTKNFLRVYVPAKHKITVTGKAGNKGYNLCLSLSGSLQQVDNVSHTEQTSLTNKSDTGAYAYIYCPAKGKNAKNYSAMVNAIALEDVAATLADYEMPATWARAPQNRALWACQNGKGQTFVSWRARSTDNDRTSYRLYRNGSLAGTFTTVTNTTIDNTATSYPTDAYRLEVLQDGAVSETMEISAGGVKPHQYFRIRLADEPVVTNTGVMWNSKGEDDGYKVRYTPDDMSCYDMDGDGEEELIVKWNPSNAQDNGYSGYTANVYIDCYKVDYAKMASGDDVDASLLWRINLGQNIRAGAHYTQFLCYDFDGDGKGEMMVKTSLGTRDGLGNYVFQDRITERGLDVTTDYTRFDDNGNKQKSNGHIGVGEEWLTVFDGTTGRELATTDYWPKFSVSDWTEGSASNKYNKGTRFKACVAMLDGVHPSAVFNRGYYTQSYFTAYNWNGKHLMEVWRHASATAGEGTYGEGSHSLVVGDFDGDGKDEIGVGAAVIDHDGSTLWRSGYGHGDALHLGDFDPDNEGLEIFYVNEEYKTSAVSSALFDAATGRVLKSQAQTGHDTGRGLAAHLSATHEGAQMLTRGDGDKAGETYAMLYTDGTPDWTGGNGDYVWQNGSLVKGFKATDDEGNAVVNDVASYPNFRIYWDGDLYDEWMDSRHVDKLADDNTFHRLYTFDTPSHPAHSLGGTKETPCLQTDLFGDWREEAVFYDCDTTTTETRSFTSKTYGDVTVEWPVCQYYLVVFTTTVPTEYKMPWLRDNHVYDMAIAWQNVGYNQPPHLSFDPATRYKATPTGICDIVAKQADDACYNLAGQRVSPTRPGLYIRGGHKVIVK